MKYFVIIFIISIQFLCVVPAGAEGLWTKFVNNNVIVAMTVQSDYLWCISEHGLIRWNTGNMTSKEYTSAQGLTDNLVAIAIDSHGDVWGASQKGIFTFDGEIWEKSIDNSSLISDAISSLVFDSNGRIYLGTHGEGLFRYDGKTWTKFGMDELPSLMINTVIFAPDGKLWVGTDNGISSYNGIQWTTYTTKDGLSHNSVNSIAFSSDNDVWVGTNVEYRGDDLDSPIPPYNGSVSRFDGSTWRTYSTKDGLPYASVRSLAIDSQDVVWTGTEKGACMYDGEKWQIYTNKEGLMDIDVSCLSIDSHNLVWTGSHNGLSCYKNGSWSTYVSDKGLSGSYVGSIEIDSNGGVWFGTHRGAYYYNGKTFRRYTTVDGLANDNCLNIAIGIDGNVWFGTQGGVSRFDGNKWTTFTSADGLASDRIGSVATGLNGEVWVSNYDNQGISRYDGVAWTKYTTENGLPSNGISLLTLCPNGDLWGVIYEQVCQYNGKTWKTYSTTDGLIYKYVYSIAAAPNGDVWFATPEGASCYNGNTWKSITRLSGINSIDVSNEGVVWFGTRYGITDGSSWLSYNLNEILRVAAGSDGVVWAGAYGGTVYRYDPNNVSEVEKKGYLPSEILIKDNYPNPFNPSTTIEFTLPSSGTANLIIYDILGRKVRELVSGQVSMGMRMVRWDGRDDSGRAVSSGVYIAKLTTGKFAAVKKMLLMK